MAVHAVQCFAREKYFPFAPESRKKVLLQCASSSQTKYGTTRRIVTTLSKRETGSVSIGDSCPGWPIYYMLFLNHIHYSIARAAPWRPEKIDIRCHPAEGSGICWCVLILLNSIGNRRCPYGPRVATVERLESMMPTTITIPIGGMSCGHCVKSVTNQLSAMPGVAAVDVSLERGEAKVTGDKLDIPALRQAIEELGFDAGEVTG